MSMKKTPESYVLQACRDYLELQGHFVERRNSGAIQDKRGIPVRMSKPGTADLFVLRRLGLTNVSSPKTKPADAEFIPSFQAVWVECKAPRGKQSDLQKQFQERVSAQGHKYILAYSIDDLIKAGL